MPSIGALYELALFAKLKCQSPRYEQSEQMEGISFAGVPISNISRMNTNRLRSEIGL